MAVCGMWMTACMGVGVWMGSSVCVFSQLASLRSPEISHVQRQMNWEKHSRSFYFRGHRSVVVSSGSDYFLAAPKHYSLRKTWLAKRRGRSRAVGGRRVHELQERKE